MGYLDFSNGESREISSIPSVIKILIISRTQQHQGVSIQHHVYTMLHIRFLVVVRVVHRRASVLVLTAFLRRRSVEPLARFRLSVGFVGVVSFVYYFG